MNGFDQSLLDAFERELHLQGKKVRDIPKLADFRVSGRAAFRRLAEGCLALAILQVILWGNWDNPLRWLNVLGVFANVTTMLYSESRVRLLTRQLNRSAAEQLLRDFNGIAG
jgi:hypothetical protein